MGYYLAAVIIAVVVGMVTRKLSAGLLAGYVFLFLAITVLSRVPTEGMKAELVPFWSYRVPELREQVIWNVVCFIPIGICSAALFRWKGIIAGVVISAVVEVIQLITMRGLFEFDDILHNSVGTMIGVVIYMIISKVWPQET